jgi:predicted HAD superfamily Cof-like phosphohydrolase
MSDFLHDQKKFMQACSQSTDVFNKEQFDLYVNLVREELQELEEAKEINDRVEILDALIDIIVVSCGALHSLGVDADGAWKEVMRSNFDKVDPRSGRVKKRQDGKILKPDNWEPPKLKNFVKQS